MSLTQQAINAQNEIAKCERNISTWWKIFHQLGGEDNYNTLELWEEALKIATERYDNIKIEYDLKNKRSSNSNNHYAITIGSAEKSNTGPCLSLWKRFISSADGKKLCEKKAFFERGENGYIHIHAVIQKPTKLSMSFKKLAQRYGKYKGKQHNFDVKPLSGLSIIKWRQYIEKDSKKSWNKTNNIYLENAEEA